VRRKLASLILALCLMPGTCWRSEAARDPGAATFRAVPVRLPPPQVIAAHLGPFALEGAWRMESAAKVFGSYSALILHADGCFTAISDFGEYLEFERPRQQETGETQRLQTGLIKRPRLARTKLIDAEAAAIDPATGETWIAWEETNAITRHGAGGLPLAHRIVPEMQNWGSNSGPEAMVRLADGRFIVLQEGRDSRSGSNRHRALLFEGDPTQGEKPVSFTFAGPDGFQPTDMAQMPDGRVLVLLRRLVWPMPPRFAGRLAIADPRTIRAGKVWKARTVALLSSSLPVDNFEGMAIEPGPGGTQNRITIWLISDDNRAVTQDTVLWRLSVDPANLP
jgi:hypothetical protein